MNDSLSPRQAFAPSCPSGGTWWACGQGTFYAGCCARDPCEITCAAGNIYPGAFDPAAYGTFPDATCGTGSKFYTCVGPPTFWGCCKTNACSQGGCPDGDLEPAILNRPDLLSAYHATGASTTLSSATQTASSVSSTATGTGQVTAEKNSTPVAAIAGGTAGGVLALAAIAGGLIYYCCLVKRKKKRNAELKAAEEQTNKDLQMRFQHPRDAPPDYTTPPQTYPPYTTDPTSYYSYNHPSHPAPQELPIDNTSSFSSPHMRKSSHTHTHARGPSELSADATLSELGSPETDTSPKARQGEFKQVPSPFVLSPLVEHEELVGSRGAGRKSRFIEMSPLSGGDGFEDRMPMVSQSPASAWVAPRDWEFDSSQIAADGGGYRGEREAGQGGYGLGVGGLDGMDDIMARMERLERLDDQRAQRGGGRPRHKDIGYAA
ncbi:hypothetical protein NX059_005262 [Plenodomus lindquistii]|nr:hypothetical protein NX059_005262 [Plenodomus lindquistii]